MAKKNVITLTDSYKMCHHKMYSDDTEVVYSYFESRPGAQFDETVFFGLQGILQDYLTGRVVTPAKLDKATALAAAHFGNPDHFNRAGWQYILDKHNGKLPLRIKAVPEGAPVPVNNVLMTVENTDPEVPWLTNYVESLLTHVWFPSTVATQSRAAKKIIKGFLDSTAESDAGLPFMLHDFGFRGVSSVESAEMGGAGHLLNFMGTDTVPAIEWAMDHYDADVCGYSVAATEHSIMTAHGPYGEIEVVRNLLKKYPTGILSVVGDSYDIFTFAEEIIGTKFRDEILARDGVFVLRPDSGDPVKTVLHLLTILAGCFGQTVNSKGYSVLNPKIRIIWGDGIGLKEMTDILQAMKTNKWSAENIVFGMGGGLLQKVNRDTQRNAFKSSAQRRTGVWHDVYKEPLDKTKTSKKGRLELDLNDGIYKTVPEGTAKNPQLVTVFENGEMVKTYTFDECRDNAKL